MFASHPLRNLPVATATFACELLAGTTSASARTADTTPPTSPPLLYAEGLRCQTVIPGATRSTDDTTPQARLRYQAFDDGVPIGFLPTGRA